ncbi:unnamed protein product [Cochlearia groenlandica]
MFDALINASMHRWLNVGEWACIFNAVNMSVVPPEIERRYRADALQTKDRNAWLEPTITHGTTLNGIKFNIVLGVTDIGTTITSSQMLKRKATNSSCVKCIAMKVC